jgi:bifunctional non-homologous end joining protein LigD
MDLLAVHADATTGGHDDVAIMEGIADVRQAAAARRFVLGPEGLSRFEELRSREAARTAILYAFDLIEHNGEDLRNHPFLDRKAALTQLPHNTEAGILLNERIVEDGLTVFAHACQLRAKGIVSKKVDDAYQSGSCRVGIKVRNPASIAVQRERSEIWNRQASERPRRR